MSRINIPKEIKDPYYRYTRSPVELKETKNCVTWTNFDVIQVELRLDPTHFVKRFQKNACMPVKLVDGKLKFKTIPFSIEDFLEAYIHRFILCKICHLPELTKGVYKACGYSK